MTRFLRSMTLLVLVGVLTGAVACTPVVTPIQQAEPEPQAAATEYIVGYAAAMTGGLAPFDTPFKEGLEVAVQELNSKGGIDGHIPISLAVKDIKSEAALAAQVAQELVDSGVDMLITGCDVDLSISSGNVAQAAGIPAISSCATTPTVPQAVGDYMFLISMGDNAQAAVLAEFAKEQGYQTAYLLGSPDTGYTQKLPEYFRAAFTKVGGEIAGEDTFTVNSTDFAAQITKIQNLSSKPDVIFTPAYVPDSAVFLKQLRAAGVDIPVLSTDGNDSPLLIEVGGDAVEGMVFTTHGFPAEGSPLEKFNKTYEEVKGGPPESVFAALGADFVAAVDAAVTKAGTTDPAAVRDALDSLEDVQGATGSITFKDQARVPLKEIALVTVKDGAFELVKTAIPSEVPAP
jgi:branched-chain amino acid transport system substrate-binding protein